jgi:hypothetical protein
MRWTKDELDAYLAKQSISTYKVEYEPVDIQVDEGSEARLQNKITKWAYEHGYPCQSNRQTSKARGLLTPGWPDVCLILPRRRVLFIECKSAKGIMRDEQKHLRQRFIFLGHEYHLVKSFRRFLELVNDL